MLNSVVPQKLASIDLHGGFSVEQARAHVISGVKECFNAGCYDILIITGRGAHTSKSGERGVLFKNMPNWLEDPEIKPFIRESQPQEGCYIVKLHEQSSPEIKSTQQSSLESQFDDLIKSLGMQEIKRLAETNPQYKGLLGYLTLFGKEAELNISRGMNLLRDAAKSGDDMSRLLLAHLSSDGTPGIAKRSMVKVTEHLEIVASSDSQHAVEAKFRLGVAYLLGRGAIQNDEKAIEFFTTAAKENHALAQLNLAIIYDAGKIIPKDDKLATFYYHAAAKQGILDAQIIMADRYLHGIGTAQSDKNAFQCRKIAAKAGDVESLFYIGNAYEAGKVVTQNIDLAYEAFRDAAEQGHIAARTRAAYILLSAKDFSDIAMGVLWLKEAVQHEHPEALYLMATLHNKGLHPFVEKNETLALELIGKSARLGFAAAQKLIFKHDLDVGLEPYIAGKWVAALAMQGDKEAEAIYIDALQQAGKQDQVQKFQQLVSERNSSTKYSPHGKVSKPIFTAQEVALDKASKVLTPQYSSTKKNPNNRKVEQDKSIDGLTSAVSAIEITEKAEDRVLVKTNKPSKPASKKRKGNKKRH